MSTVIADSEINVNTAFRFFYIFFTNKCVMPESNFIGAEQACLSMLLLKLIAG